MIKLYWNVRREDFMKKHIIFALLFIIYTFIQTSAIAKPAEVGDIIYKEASKTANVINPTTLNNAVGAFFPGLRGTNQLVIYTPEFGYRTNTNEFGTEAIIVENVAVQLNGADSIIPKNGFVVSGHGSAKKWINENIVEGTKVYYNPQTRVITTYLTPDSFIFNAQKKIDEVNSIVEYYKYNHPYYNLKKTNFYLGKAKDLIKDAKRHPDKVQKTASLSAHAAQRAMENAIPYMGDELKGVWIRPTEKSASAITATLDRLNNAGITNVFLETYFHGKTIFPSYILQKYGVTNQREEFMGFDPLEIWIKEAHARGMKIHAWFETFYVGNTPPQNEPNSILAVYPQWGNKTKAKYDSEIAVSSLSEHNGYFIDPANPDVQTFVLELAEEILTKYDVDGINLDYIRYPQSIDSKYTGYDKSNWGYSEFCREDFQLHYGVDPLDIEYGTPEWELWAKYRQGKITETVRAFRVLTLKKGKMLTAVIFPDRRKSLDTKMQDWKTWSLSGLVDGFTPLILTCDKQTANALIKDITTNSTKNTKIYAGIFVPFMNGSSEDMLRQIHESRKLKTNGIIFFDYAHFKDSYIESLKQSVCNPTLEKKALENELKNAKNEFSKRK